MRYRFIAPPPPLPNLSSLTLPRPPPPSRPHRLAKGLKMRLQARWQYKNDTRKEGERRYVSLQCCTPHKGKTLTFHCCNFPTAGHHTGRGPRGGGH